MDLEKKKNNKSEYSEVHFNSISTVEKHTQKVYLNDISREKKKTNHFFF